MSIYRQRLRPFKDRRFSGRIRGVASKLKKAWRRDYGNYPFYGNVKANKYPLEKTDIQFEVKIGDTIKIGGVHKGLLPDAQVPIYFLDNEQYFGRGVVQLSWHNERF